MTLFALVESLDGSAATVGDDTRGVPVKRKRAGNHWHPSPHRSAGSLPLFVADYIPACYADVHEDGCTFICSKNKNASQQDANAEVNPISLFSVNNVVATLIKHLLA